MIAAMLPSSVAGPHGVFRDGVRYLLESRRPAILNPCRHLRNGLLEEIRSHPHLLRSWDLGDDDYSGHALDMLVSMVTRDPGNLKVIEEYVLDANSGVPIVLDDGRNRLTICPRVFELPKAPSDPLLVAIMMPFEAGFASVYAAIKVARSNAGFTCERVDNIW